MTVALASPFKYIDRYQFLDCMLAISDKHLKLMIAASFCQEKPARFIGLLS